MRSTTISIWLMGCALLACNGTTTVDLGSNDDAGSADTGSGAEGDATLAPEIDDLSGTYLGYVESYMFPDGSDTVQMALRFAQDGTITGTVRLGDLPLYPPPTDPNVGYPPGIMPGSEAYEGFEFTIVKGAYTSPRVQLWLVEREVYKQWCELQTTIYPIYNGGTCDGGVPLSYNCLPNAGGGEVQGNPGQCDYFTACSYPQMTIIDCGKFKLCTQPGLAPCTCTATQCTVPLVAPEANSFDMTLSGSSLDGSTSFFGGPFDVHLSKQ